jgi:nitroimidazol reductase NimA-like FMN-containing flavoprotein (pyridoxamine 5'-phosphate oxidase superfamily)
VADDQAPTGAGDVGRRVAHRRAELGLSREEVAERAGISPTYLAYLETSPAQPNAGQLMRLASALETSYPELAGGTMQLPPGQSRPSGHPRLEQLGAEECRTLLGERGVGRLVFNASPAPLALPVNYAMFGDDVVFRTAPDSALMAAVGNPVTFEVDHIDDAMSEGWSVVASGRLDEIDDDADRERVASLRVEPWAGGEGREVVLRVRVDSVSGRRISAG